MAIFGDSNWYSNSFFAGLVFLRLTSENSLVVVQILFLKLFSG